MQFQGKFYGARLFFLALQVYVRCSTIHSYFSTHFFTFYQSLLFTETMMLRNSTRNQNRTNDGTLFASKFFKVARKLPKKQGTIAEDLVDNSLVTIVKKKVNTKKAKKADKEILQAPPAAKKSRINWLLSPN